MSTRTLFLTFVAAALVGLTGCGPAPLDVTKTRDLETSEGWKIELAPQPQPQKITVEYEAGTKVTVGVYRAEDATRAASADPEKAIAAEKEKKEGSFTADVPANTEYAVVVNRSDRQTTVKVRVTNRK